MGPLGREVSALGLQVYNEGDHNATIACYDMFGVAPRLRQSRLPDDLVLASELRKVKRRLIFAREGLGLPRSYFQKLALHKYIF